MASMMMKRTATATTKKRPTSANDAITTNAAIDVAIAKKVKTRLREEKEMKKLFETIAQRLLADQRQTISTEIEAKCRDIVARSFGEIRHELFNIESSMSARIVHLEGKLNTTNNRIEEVQMETNRKFTTLQGELENMNKEFKSALENERTKRLTTFKKMNEQYDSSLVAMQNNINGNKSDSINAISALNDDIKVHSKELTGLKDKLDEILIKQFGYLPNSRVGVNNNGFDAGGILDGITQRLQRLEVAVVNEDELNTSYENNARLTPMRAAIGNKSTLSRVRKLEEHTLELQSQIKENEIDIQQLKSSLVNKIRTHESSRSPIRERQRDTAYHEEEPNNRHGYGASFSDMKELDKRIKKLAENTTKACRSLSSGLTEVQQATLNLYTWTDQVHDSFDRIAQKIELPTNICPRAKVSSKSKSKFEFN